MVNLEVTGHYTTPAHHCIVWTQLPQLQTPDSEEQSVTWPSPSVTSHVKWCHLIQSRQTSGSWFANFAVHVPGFQTECPKNTLHSNTKTWLKICWKNIKTFGKHWRARFLLNLFLIQLPILYKRGCDIFWTQNKHSMLTILKKAVTFAGWFIQMYFNGLMGSAGQWQHVSSTGIRTAQTSDLKWKLNIRDYAALRKQQDWIAILQYCLPNMI